MSSIVESRNALLIAAGAALAAFGCGSWGASRSPSATGASTDEASDVSPSGERDSPGQTSGGGTVEDSSDGNANDTLGQDEIDTPPNSNATEDTDASAAGATDVDHPEESSEEPTQPDEMSDVPDAPDASPTPIVPPCPVWSAGTVNGFVLSFSVREASGVVESRRHAGALWLHNDSGGDPELFAISTTGRPLGTFVLDGAGTRDWEDIAVGPGPDPSQTYLYIADIGDNGASRPDVQVYRSAEPALALDADVPVYERLSGVETFVFAYPDGAHNAETFLVDPLTGDAYIVVKAGDGISPVFRAAAPLSPATTTVLEQVTTLRFGTAPLVGNATTTGGDITPRGDAIAIRTYDSAYLWRRTVGMTVADALASEPCALPLQEEQQGEALGFAADGAGYYTVSEGGFPKLWYFARQP